MQEFKIETFDPAVRRAAVRRALRLQWLTVIWNICEGVLAIIAGIPAGSVALLGFGVDSLIETASAVVVAVRLRDEANGAASERVEVLEERSRKIAGSLLLLLACYVAFDAIRQLIGFGDRAHESLLGLAVTTAALIVMPFLSRAKLKAAAEINSAALKADAMQTTCCAWLSLTTLAGLALNASFHWWWADALAGCAIVPLLVREGLEALRGETCGCHQSCDSQ